MCCPSTIVPRLRQAGRPRRAAPTSSRRPTTAGRRRPRCRVNLKCFTALVTYSRSRWIPAAASALSSSLPAGPTNGAPALSCWSRLLADQHDVRGRRSRPEHRLVGVQIQVAALAAWAAAVRSARLFVSGTKSGALGLRRPVEKSGTQLALEALHLRTQGSLGHVFPLCSTAKVPFLGDRNEVLTKPKC